MLARNELGVRLAEVWDAGDVLPFYLQAQKDTGLKALVDAAAPGLETLIASETWSSSSVTLLIILDALENAGSSAAKLLEEALDRLIRACESVLLRKRRRAQGLCRPHLSYASRYCHFSRASALTPR